MLDRDRIRKKFKNLWKDGRSYTLRLAIAGCAVLALCFTFAFFGPLELVAFSGGSLVFSWQDVIWLLIAMMAGGTAVLTPLVALLRGKLFNYTVTVLCAATLSGYLQAMLLNGNLGLLTGDAIAWNEQTGAMWGSLLVWAAVLAALLLLMYLHRKYWAYTVMAISGLLVVMQLVPTIAIFCGSYDGAQPDKISGYYLSDRDFAKLGDDNVYVFVLDRLDYDYIEQLMRSDPDLLEGLDGFTSYTNAISGYARTRPALTHLFTGAEDYTYRVPASTYYQQAWEENNILDTIAASNYDISMYSSIRYLFSNPDTATKYAKNATNGNI